MNNNQYYVTPYNNQYPTNYNNDDDERILPFLAGLAITAPFWGGGWWGRRCCPYPYPYPVPYPYPSYPYTYNTYAGVVGSPYSYYYNQPFVY